MCGSADMTDYVHLIQNLLSTLIDLLPFTSVRSHADSEYSNIFHTT